MGGLNFKTILFGTVIALMLVSIVYMSLTSYNCSNAKKYDIDDAKSPKQVKEVGVDAAAFYADHKMWFIIPNVCNVVGMMVVGVLFAMG